jgi:4-diphosphocytidyl-2-C-methyl-D-erythritol kinase
VNKLAINSYAKVNLFLSVKNKRPDGYHTIESIFERISLCDRINIEKRSDKRIVLRCSDPGLPSGKNNLAVKAALLLSRRYGITKGVTIDLLKRIPTGAGMGGGSSNAAAVLSGLNKLWDLGLSEKQLVHLAAEIGSDVPFFVYNCSFALVKGRGDLIKPLPVPPKVRLWHVIVVPKIQVSTPLIYKHWDKLDSSKKISVSMLTRPASDAKLILLALNRQGPDFGLSGLFNSLEAVTMGLYPRVLAAKQAFSGLGIKTILMTGSGSAVFGIVSSRKEAAAFSKKLKAQNRFWRIFVASTV